MYWKSNAA